MRDRDKSASNFSGRPISPKQIEKSLVLAKNRRLDTSKIRENHKTKEEKEVEDTDTSLSTSRSSERMRNRGLKQKQKRRNMQQNCKTTIRYKLPMQEVVGHSKDGIAKPDFEPIIIEEVYYNENIPHTSKHNRKKNSVSITPSVMLNHALKI